MKKIVTIGLALVMIIGTFALTGCGNGTSKYNYNLDNYIKLGEYKGLTYTKPEDVKVTDKMVDEAIKSDLASAATLEDVKDKTVHDGNVVNIDYEGKIDGKKFDGGSAKGTSLVIGSNTMIDGFESGLLGHKVGETVKLNLTFPKNYPNNKNLAGKDATFKVKINAVQNSVEPSEKEYVKNQGKYKTVADYEKAKKKELEKQYKEQSKMSVKSDLWNQISASSEVKKYPEKEINAYKEKTETQMKEYAKQQNMELDKFIKQTYGVEKKEFDKQMQSSAEQFIKSELIIYAIADKENLKVTDKDLEEYKENQLKMIGYTEEQFEAQAGQTFEEYMGGKEQMESAVLYEKVMDFVTDNAKVEKASKKADTNKKSENKDSKNTKKDTKAKDSDK